MGLFSKKEDKPAKPKNPTIVVKTTIVKGRDLYNISDEYKVMVEGSGFVGNGKGYSASRAFEEAYEDLLSHMAGAILSE